ncbi:MAG: DUF4349 domain-containing protein [Deltaproteobacteria bacterium]|nr:DUF4349 domain-containing protein [Deltaproteobacteria bacterium]MBN2671696.1 DUF4349 domain-containing protein [Deltaproteobacteria bacterium]
MKSRLITVLLFSGTLLFVGAATAKNKKNTDTPDTAKQTEAATANTDDAQTEPAKEETSETSTPAENSSPTEETDVRLTSIQSRMTLKVVNPDEAREQLKKIAASYGGYATRITDTNIVLKVPPTQITQAMEAFVKQGILVEKTIERKDLTLKIAQLEGKLTSQNEILAKLRSFFDDSDFTATLEIERSMSRLVYEIEQVKGELRYLYDQAEWAVVEVDFRFRERESVMYVSSPFEWLNSANLSTFLEEF